MRRPLITAVYTFIVTLLIILISHNAYAQGEKTITLRDGSVVKGRVLSMQDGVYAVDTTHMGLINISEHEVLNILDPSSAQPAPGSNNSFKPMQGSVSGNDGNLQNQVNQLQGQIMADPQMMLEIQELVNDEEIKAILSDENFIKDIMSYDQSTIEGNSKTQNLMQNPKMKALMEKMNQKLEPAQ